MARAQPRQVIITDIRRHWAQQWIAPVVRAGIMDTLPNYEFEPARQRAPRRPGADGVARAGADCARSSRELAKKWQGAQSQSPTCRRRT